MRRFTAIALWALIVATWVLLALVVAAALRGLAHFL